MTTEKERVDIVGDMHEVTGSSWQERARLLAKPDLWTVTCRADAVLISSLSDSEIERLLKKVAIVEKFARWQLAGMVKGTVKYATDSLTLDDWMASICGEGADFANYIALMFDKYQALQGSASKQNDQPPLNVQEKRLVAK